MSVKEEKVVVCDGCGKQAKCEKHSEPPDPWVYIYLSGHWLTDYGAALKGGSERHDYSGNQGRVDACSATCAIVALDKVKQRLQRVIERFPEAMKINA